MSVENEDIGIAPFTLSYMKITFEILLSIKKSNLLLTALSRPASGENTSSLSMRSLHWLFSTFETPKKSFSRPTHSQ